MKKHAYENLVWTPAQSGRPQRGIGALQKGLDPEGFYIPFPQHLSTQVSNDIRSGQSLRTVFLGYDRLGGSSR